MEWTAGYEEKLNVRSRLRLHRCGGSRWTIYRTHSAEPGLLEPRPLAAPLLIAWLRRAPVAWCVCTCLDTCTTFMSVVLRHPSSL